MIRRRKRPGYTLLEIVLALAIAVLLLAALYSAVGYQLRQAQGGRDVTSQTTLSRSIVQRIETDVMSSLALSDPARFRNQSTNSQAQQAQQSGQSSSGQSSSGQSTAGQGTNVSTSKVKNSAGGTTAVATGGNSSAAGASSNSGNSSTQLPTAQPADATDDSNGMAGGTNPIVLPFGVMGDSQSLTLYVSRVPGELYGSRASDGGTVSDLRKIHYWLADGGMGLCRQEVRVATAAEALTLDPPGGDVKNYLLAPEVKSIEFRYFNGSTWADSWDSTTLGDDTVTPIGAPRAIEVRVGVLPPGGKDGDELKYYRHTIAILTSNGITQSSNPGQ
jgi:prepilin-type N-terminal cleavage/methylation domain-containing protein